MAIKYVILGFLSHASMTGYELKKTFAESEIFHWSGNNNQIYRALVALHEADMATVETQQQASKPPRKIYSITDKGRAALKEWVQTLPDLPQVRNPLLVQLHWADQLTPGELAHLLARYEEELRVHSLMLHEQLRRANDASQAASPVQSLRQRIAGHWMSYYELELEWVRNLRRELGAD